MSLTEMRASCTTAEMTARSSASSARSRNRASGAIHHPLDACAAGSQLLLKPLIAAVEMVDAADYRLALGDKTGDDQRHRSAQVGRHHRCPCQPLYAANQRGR